MVGNSKKSLKLPDGASYKGVRHTGLSSQPHKKTKGLSLLTIDGPIGGDP